jgi:DNA-binding beta-propeller fold protein YncE
MPKPKATISAEPVWGFLHETSVAGADVADGSEVVVFDAARNWVLVLGKDGVDILGSDGVLINALPKSELGVTLGDGNSVAVHGDRIAIAYSGATAGSNGLVAINEVSTTGAITLDYTVAVGAVPDMVTFTPDGRYVLVAIEGEPTANYASDPAGGVWVIEAATGINRFAGFGAFDTDALKAAGVRITGPAGTLAATDLEPEYIAISADGRTAYVTLQENNAIAVLDLDAAGGPVFTDVFALGAKDFSRQGAGFDASDRDGPGNAALKGNIQEWPVYGLYMPDAIATFDKNGKTYLVTANEGDAREYGSYVELARVSTLDLDDTAFPDEAFLKDADNLGRLEVLTNEGDFDGDGDYDALYTLGGRSFTIWEVQKDGLKLAFDSGDLIERTLFQVAPNLLDDGRSDNKGPEPEHVALAELGGEIYAFVGLERSNAIMAFHIKGPQKADYAGLITTAGDIGPETFTVVEGDAAGSAVLYVANEVSQTTRAYDLTIAVDGTIGGPPLTLPSYDLI